MTAAAQTQQSWKHSPPETTPQWFLFIEGLMPGARVLEFACWAICRNPLGLSSYSSCLGETKFRCWHTMCIGVCICLNYTETPAARHGCSDAKIQLAFELDQAKRAISYVLGRTQRVCNEADRVRTHNTYCFSCRKWRQNHLALVWQQVKTTQ